MPYYTRKKNLFEEDSEVGYLGPYMIARPIGFILTSFLKISSISNLLLSHMPLHRIRNYVGADFLSPIQQFALYGYTLGLIRRSKVPASGNVIVLGGYLGDSTFAFREFFNCEVFVLEPVPEYFCILKERFQNDQKVHLFNFAASDNDLNVNLVVDGERTGEFQNGQTSIEVPAVNISKFIEKLDVEVDVIEINIEGGEYDVVRNLIETLSILKCRQIVIQFHRLGLTSEVQRSGIRLALSESHNQKECFEWVWEVWEIKN